MKPALSKGQRVAKSTLPLEGVRVADFSWQLAGPIATRYLATFGAEVIKIESAVRVDTLRKFGPFPPSKKGLNASSLFNTLNYSKKSCAINLSTREGRDLAMEIVRVSDVVVENFAYGVMERLGLGYAEMARGRPDIIMLSLSGMGRTGPHKAYVAYGTTLHAYSGIFSNTGYAGGPPRALSGTWSDPVTGSLAAFLVAAAVHKRRKTGQGQYIDLAMSEVTWSIMPEPLLEYILNGEVIERTGNDNGLMAPCNTYACRGDDQWLAIAVGNDDEWAGLCRAMDKPDWAGDGRFADIFQRWKHRDLIDNYVANWVRGQDKWQLASLLQEAGVPATPCLNADELAQEQHLWQRGFFRDIDHPEVGKGPTLGLPAQITATTRYDPAPLLGQHTDEILRDLLGVSEERLKALSDGGILS